MMIRSIALAAAVLMAPLAQAGAPQVQTQQGSLAALVAVYRALGGGWVTS